jgi:hypothetical protein
MIKELRIIVFLFPFLWTNMQSQQLSHQVLVPLAGLSSGGNITYSQTVGETAVEVTGCTFYIFTQGFQQPDIKYSEKDKPSGSGVKVYPNPVNDFLTIEMYGEEAKTFRIEIIDVAGKIIRSERREFCDNFWFREPQSVKDLTGGLYMIRIISDDGLFNRTFRIEKI